MSLGAISKRHYTCLSLIPVPKNSLPDIIKPKKCNIILLVFVLVSAASTLYMMFDFRKVESGCLYLPQFTDIQIKRIYQVFGSLQAADADNNCSGGTLMYGEYCALSPYEDEVRDASKTGSVTLCTQATVEYLQHVVVLCKRWARPISVALYSPPEDYEEAHTIVRLLRQCDSCVRYWVSWHFFFNKRTGVPPVEQSKLYRDCIFFVQLKKPRIRRSRDLYPINVGRNIARRFTTTPFVFSIDIELYPTPNVPSKFERMLRSQVLSADNQVWVLPVFQVQPDVRPPILKSQLRDMYARGQAISFRHDGGHDDCHRIPNLTQWMSHGEGTTISEMEEALEPLKIWTTVKRTRRNGLNEWEPFFIGTTKDPEFDVRLSWEGKENKKQMAYEMCMRNYDFHVIENAFLIHAPEINKYIEAKEKERVKYLANNTKVINMVKKSLTDIYGWENDC